MAQRKKPKPSERQPVAIRMPTALREAMDKRARAVGMTRTTYLEQIIRRDLKMASVPLEREPVVLPEAEPETVFG
jgi:hypothetical protein